jgi:hypothetical protein
MDRPRASLVSNFYPCFENSTRKGRLALDAPGRRTDRVELGGEHRFDLVAPFHRLDVPSEGGEVAPKALVAKERSRAGGIACVERLAERGDPALSLIGSILTDHSSFLRLARHQRRRV